MKLLVETYIIIIYESSIPLCYNDIKASQLYIPFDTDKVSTTACPEMRADILVGQRDQPAHVIPCFLLNERLLQVVELQ
jgi:hypothetical protein